MMQRNLTIEPDDKGDRTQWSQRRWIVPSTDGPPLVLMIAALLAGILMVQLSNLEDGPESIGEHWGRRATMSQRSDAMGWHRVGQQTELGLLPGRPGRADGTVEAKVVRRQLGARFSPSGEGQPNMAMAPPEPAVIRAAGQASEVGQVVSLSSHQRDVGKDRKRGLRLPMLYLRPVEAENR